MNAFAMRTFICACVSVCKCDNNRNSGWFARHMGSKWIVCECMTRSLCLLHVVISSHWHEHVVDHHVFVIHAHVF
jgi:hypothetical protein